jgi:DMSO/TMAO reductase YedYZ molybdopterin-dependent catalytic subunit
MTSRDRMGRMNMVKRLLRVFVALAALVSGIAAAQTPAGAQTPTAPQPPTAGQVTTSVQVGGAFAHPATLSVDDLRRYPVHTMDEVRTDANAKSHDEEVRHHTGVLLRDVLDKADIVEAARHDKRRTVIVATASDGYHAVFSWAELYLTPIGDGVLVVFEHDGKPLDDREGRIALVSVKDTHTGPRHVRWLQRVDVVRVGADTR